MASLIPNSRQRGSGSFQKVTYAFLASEGLPFAEILSVDRIQCVFAKHGCPIRRRTRLSILSRKHKSLAADNRSHGRWPSFR